MMSSRFNHRIAAACVAVSATVAMAADPTTDPAVKPVMFTLSGNANYAADTDLHDSGSVSVFRSLGTVAIDAPLTQADTFRVVVDGEYTHYFFRNLSAVPGDDGSDSLDAYMFDVRPTLSHYFNDHFGVFGGVVVSASGMSEAKFGDSMSYGVFAGVNYKIAPNLWIGGGFIGVTQLEDNPYVVPLITLNWDVTPNLSIASEGLGFKATYKLDDAWSVYARGKYEWRQFRLDSHEVLEDGVITDQSVPLSVGVSYKPFDALTVSGEVGVVAWRRLDFTESNGHQFSADETDPAAFVSVQVSYSF